MNALAIEQDYDTDQELRRMRRDGSLIRVKAAMILEEFGLPDSAAALRSSSVAQEVKERVKLNLMKLAGFDQPQLGTGGGGFNIVINLAGPAAPMASVPLDVTPRVVERVSRARRVNADLAAGLEDY